jgi:hypothetical protein
MRVSMFQLATIQVQLSELEALGDAEERVKKTLLTMDQVHGRAFALYCTSDHLLIDACEVECFTRCFVVLCLSSCAWRAAAGGCCQTTRCPRHLVLAVEHYVETCVGLVA